MNRSYRSATNYSCLLMDQRKSSYRLNSKNNLSKSRN